MAFHFASLLLLALPVFTRAQSPVWGQCGGLGWTGPTTCVSGSVCTRSNDWYSQCLPGNQPPPPSTTIPPPADPPITTTSTPPPPTSLPTGAPPPPIPFCATIPGNITYSNTRLPDPFLPIGGGTRVSTKGQWECRRREISELFQRYELGVVPPKPSSVTASFSGGTLSITVANGGPSISFSVSITAPSTGTAPFPAIIAYGAPSIPVPNSVAVIRFNNDDIAVQQNTGSRGSGKFYTLYGNNHSAGALAAWAWGVSRIVDALEITPSARIDTTRLAVTGCSRNGKGAIVAGAFEPRIALTIPQESGSGGSACWRLSDYQKSQGQNVQTASQIITENVWFSKNFDTFTSQVSRLSVDHHLLPGLIVPRGLLVIENTSQEWLGALSSYQCQRVGRRIYEAYGVPNNMGVSQVGNHNHCAFPSSQQAELTAFFNKFLLGQGSTNTSIVRTDGSFNFPETQFIDWTTPTLA
ncbi:carbohydrate-binding module family 1 [Pluteus cervinus]|uniref:Carbohydrate-binding module family 1 n=1 Tax=Pluteus cervinus TaxID=181527 RepID=A0ACD3B2I5_9AGAR|nr:carbohydrate-binding module family 1 [Pluteus cervinus]